MVRCTSVKYAIFFFFVTPFFTYNVVFGLIWFVFLNIHNVSLQQNMISLYQPLVLDLIILLWKQLLLHKHVSSYFAAKTLVLLHS